MGCDLDSGAWEPYQRNMVAFVLLDVNGEEVEGLGNGFTLEISNAGGGFLPAAGDKAEMGHGWYSYLCTAEEAEPGPVSLRVTGPGLQQQNLEYVVRDRRPNAVSFPYTLTHAVTGAPLVGARVTITTDEQRKRIVWVGTTDTFGEAKDENGLDPYLDEGGPYYFWRYLPGFSFENPDIEVVG